MLKGSVTKRRSDATNSYDLLTDVIKYMLEEPKRIYMGDWIISGKDRIRNYLDSDGPVCGTVGCIAGNVSMLTGEATDPWNADRYLSGNGYNLRRALSALFLNTEVPARYGTKKYAQIVAKRVRDFQKKHKKALQTVDLSQRL